MQPDEPGAREGFQRLAAAMTNAANKCGDPYAGAAIAINVTAKRRPSIGPLCWLILAARHRSYTRPPDSPPPPVRLLGLPRSSLTP